MREVQINHSTLCELMIMTSLGRTFFEL